eukprot:2077154-Pyramimonas_sp.AAC.1
MARSLKSLWPDVGDLIFSRHPVCQGTALFMPAWERRLARAPPGGAVGGEGGTGEEEADGDEEE